ncbi:MAG TPA: LON peptidase substrate-binding domain-containing protein [Verrucomicrobiae bacterium]|jgi:ATP-dependent Lon protease|nr:LON peptidase substrate-binding domain-containing protein [Verrucomicrobiae bacterium]
MDVPDALLKLLALPGKPGVVEAPVMTVPSVTLFPQALLPLYIFEPRYRRMLAEALASHRMFIVAMEKPGSRGTPLSIAGLGLIRVCVENPDGTSHLILQGVARVELGKAVRVRPYRMHRVRPLQAPSRDSVTIDALLAKVRDLVSERIELGPPPMFPAGKLKGKSKQTIMAYLNDINDPEEVADLVSCFLLPGPEERQTILETVEVEPRLKHLIHFLMAEITRHRKKKKI